MCTPIINKQEKKLKLESHSLMHKRQDKHIFKLLAQACKVELRLPWNSFPLVKHKSKRCIPELVQDLEQLRSPWAMVLYIENLFLVEESEIGNKYKNELLMLTIKLH